MVENNISYGGDADGAVSLDPLKTDVVMLVYLNGQTPARFKTRVYGPAAYRLDIAGCAARKAFPDALSGESLYPQVFPHLVSSAR